MLKKILILLFPVLGFVGGAVGGDMLHATAKPAEETAHAPETDTAAPASADTAADGHAAPKSGGHGGAESPKAADGLDWFKFPNQFFVPIIRNGTSTAVMVLSITIEIPASARPAIEAQEHNLRDALLSALMTEANTGGFDGNFTTEPNLRRVRETLQVAAQRAAGPDARRILIEDIGRQEQ